MRSTDATTRGRSGSSSPTDTTKVAASKSSAPPGPPAYAIRTPATTGPAMLATENDRPRRALAGWRLIGLTVEGSSPVKAGAKNASAAPYTAAIATSDGTDACVRRAAGTPATSWQASRTRSEAIRIACGPAGPPRRRRAAPAPRTGGTAPRRPAPRRRPHRPIASTANGSATRGDPVAQDREHLAAEEQPVLRLVAQHRRQPDPSLRQHRHRIAAKTRRERPVWPTGPGTAERNGAPGATSAPEARRVTGDRGRVRRRCPAAARRPGR